MSVPLDAFESTPIDIARRLLTDTSRCPSCGAVLAGSRCGVCGVELSGPDGAKVWALSTNAARLLTERDVVLRGMRAQARDRVHAGASGPSSQSSARSQPPAAPTTGAPWPPRPPRPSGPDPAKDPAGGPDVHGLLVGVGALLLAVASVGFLVFSWRVLSLQGRATVIGITTLGVLSVASWLRSRLPSTAEAVGALGVVLVLADCWAIRRTGLLGADRPEGLGYAAGAAACCALLLGGWALSSRVRAGSIAAVGLAPLALVLLAARLEGTCRGLAIGFVLAAALALGRVLLPVGWQLERRVLRWIGAVGLIVAALLQAGTDREGAGSACLVLLAASFCAAAQTMADLSVAGSARRSMPISASVFLRRGWSLGAGLLTGGAAIEAGLALAGWIGLDNVLQLLPVASVPALAVLLSATIPARPSAALRRTAFGAGTSIAAAAAGLPVLLLAGWLPVRAGLAAATGPWTAHPATKLAEIGSAEAAGTAHWAVVFAALLTIAAAALLTCWICAWPAWLCRPVLLTAATALVAALVVLPLAPGAPIGAAVIGLVLIAAVLTLVVVELEDRASALMLKAGWTASALTGTLAVVLAWSTRELSVPLTLIGLGGLLLARRRTSAVTGSGAALAALAAAAGLVAIGATAGLAGASPQLRVTWSGAAGGLLVALLLGLPRWLPAARPDRAAWTGTDRLAAAAAGLAALLLGLLGTLPADDFFSAAGSVDPAWPRRLLLAVALIACLTGACAVRPAVVRLLPIVPLASAFAVGPVLGLLAGSIRPALSALSPVLSDTLPLALLWAIAAGVGALTVTAAVLAGRVDPGRRVAAELGIASTALIALVTVDGASSLWRVLLVLGAGAAAIGSAPDRRQVGWLAGALLLGSTWTRLMLAGVDTVEAYSLPPAVALLALAGYRLRRDRDADAGRALAPAASVGFGPSIVVAAGGGQLRPAVLIALAAGLVLAALELRRRGRQPALGAALAAIGAVMAGGTAVLRSGAVLLDIGSQIPPLSSVELWTGPAAVIMLAQGVLWFARMEASAGPAPGGRSARPSWPAFAPGLLVLLLPSFCLGLIQPDGSALRQLIVIALAGAVLALGSIRSLQAPVLLGAGILTAQALVLLSPWLAVLPTAIPVWGWLAAVGLGLLLLGAGYERRLRQLRSLRLRLAALR